MKKTVILFSLAASFLLLQSFQSCRQELVMISVENNSEDTIYCASRITAAFGTLLDVFEGGYAFEDWKTLPPKANGAIYKNYFEGYDEEDTSWKIWIVNKRDLGGMTLAVAIDTNMLDSLCSLKKVYTYDELKALNFVIKYY